MPFKDICLATLVVGLWGVNFVAAKFGMQHFPPFFLTAVRFMFVAAILIPFFPRPDKEGMIKIFQLAFVLGTLHFALLFGSLWHGLDIATGTIMTQLGVPFSCALSVIFLGDRMGMWRTMGMVIAFIGVMLVAGTPVVSNNYTGFLMALAGAFAWGVANLLMKRMGPIHIYTMLGWMALYSVPQLLLISWVLEGNQWGKLLTTPLPAALGLTYTVLCSTLIAYGIWYRLLHKYDVSQVAPFALLGPFFGITAGQIFFDEPLTWQLIVGGMVTLVGVGIIIFRRPRMAELGEST